MNIIELTEQQVKQAEKDYFTALDLVAETLGYPHPRDPRVKDKKPA